MEFLSSSANKLLRLRSLAILFSISIIAFYFMIFFVRLPQFKLTRYQHNYGTMISTSLIRQVDQGIYSIYGELTRNTFTTTNLNFHTSGCILDISVAGEILYKGSKEKCEDAEIDLNNFLRSGQNDIQINIQHPGGPVFMNITSNPKDDISLLAGSMLLITILVMIGLALYEYGFGVLSIGIIIFAICLRIFYTTYTDPFTRGYDTEGHIDHIEFIVQNNRSPNPDDCWECYQPPGYYYIGALVYKLGLALSQNPLAALQIFSLALSVVYIVAGALIIHLLVKHKILEGIGIALFSLWPSSIINATRISNDVVLYAVIAIAMYFIFRWMKQRYFEYLLFASALSGFAMIFKTNSLIILGIILTSLCIIEFEPTWKKARSIFIKILLVIISFGIAAAPALAIKLNSTGNKDPIIGNIDSLHSKLIVGSGIENFTKIDINSFFSEPFAYPWDDIGGRQYFWTYLIKTSLYGEFSYNFAQAKEITSVMVISLLLILGFYLVSLIICLVKGYERRLQIAILLGIGVFVGFLLAARIRYPYSAVGDFRFIVPVTILLATSIMTMMQSFLVSKKRYLKIWVCLGTAFIITFGLATTIFFYFVKSI